ncbi:MAG: lactonase family protein [Acidobacteria bacterium]|nr:lactonase family protein [Acidobacteriota bacterium]
MKLSCRLSLFLMALLAALSLTPAVPGAEKSAGKGEYFVYIGTYTGEKSKGIYAFRFDAAKGQATPLGLVAEESNPSFLAVHPNRRFLYAVSEIGDYQGKKSGAVSAFAIDPASGKLTFLNKVPSRGDGPCHLSVDKSGKCVLVANYGGGSVAALPVKEDGRLGEASAFVQHTGSSVNPQRQEGPHAHSINVSLDNRFAVAADLGLDEVLVYHLDPVKGSLTPNDPPFAKVNPGAGPRHFAFHPGGRFAYVINEIQSTVTAFAYDASRGTLKELQTISTLPAGFKGESYTAEVQVHPSGRFLYGSNRGHDSIAVFAIDPAQGTLTALEQVSTQGKTPRNFGIDPTGSYLFAADQGSDKIVLFRIDPKTGRLTPTGQTLEAPSPVCVKFVAVK